MHTQAIDGDDEKWDNGYCIKGYHGWRDRRCKLVNDKFKEENKKKKKK